MKKAFQIGFGVLFIVLGGMMLLLVLRDGGNGGNAGQAALAPLGLISAGALAIAAARRKPKQW
jgi:hypothetical protein